MKPHLLANTTVEKASNFGRSISPKARVILIRVKSGMVTHHARVVQHGKNTDVVKNDLVEEVRLLLDTRQAPQMEVHVDGLEERERRGRPVPVSESVVERSHDTKPHEGVVTRLGVSRAKPSQEFPSGEPGVGVFAIVDIKKGDPIFGDDDDPTVSVSRSEVEKLPAEEREVVGLIFYHGWKQAEVADLFGISERTVRRRWESAKEKLGHVLKAQRP